MEYPSMLREVFRRWFGYYPSLGVLLPTMDRGGMPVVTPLSALSYTPVYRAVSLIAQDTARIGFRTSAPLLSTLLNQPNAYLSGYEFRRSMMLQATLYGNAFALINRTRGGEVFALEILDVESVQLDVSRDEPFYRSAQYGDLPVSDVFHLRALGFGGLWGESPVRVCRTALTIMGAQESAQLEVMRNAGNPKLAIVHPGPLSAGARQSIAEKFQSDHGGAENAGKPLVLAEGMKVERISSTLEDAGISAARSYSIEDVSRIYGVPAHMLGMASSGNAYGSIEWMGRTYVDSCLSHWLSAFRSEVLAKLAGPADTFDFDIDQLIRPSLAEQFAALRTGVEAGIITRNEARERLDLDPLDGLDTPTLALNMGTGGGSTNLGSDTSAEAGSVDDFAS
jgi:HK97 family phage portal protein